MGRRDFQIWKFLFPELSQSILWVAQTFRSGQLKQYTRHLLHLQQDGWRAQVLVLCRQQGPTTGSWMHLVREWDNYSWSEIEGRILVDYTERLNRLAPQFVWLIAQTEMSSIYFVLDVPITKSSVFQSQICAAIYLIIWKIMKKFCLVHACKISVIKVDI